MITFDYSNALEFIGGLLTVRHEVIGQHKPSEDVRLGHGRPYP